MNLLIRRAFAAAILIVATIGLTSCDGEADHWIIIHDKVEFTGGTDGQSDTCLPPETGDIIAYLPACLTVKQGDKIGFFNYSKNKITVEHFNSLDAPSTFEVAPHESKVFKVIVQGTLVQINFKTTIDHGGPNMIIEP
jgi:hypothetical protein